MDPLQSGLLRRIYNPRERAPARSVGPNPTGAANRMLPCSQDESGKAEI
jgi:hypothetical protein